jgi:hypothetical protein
LPLGAVERGRGDRPCWRSPNGGDPRRETRERKGRRSNPQHNGERLPLNATCCFNLFQRSTRMSSPQAGGGLSCFMVKKAPALAERCPKLRLWRHARSPSGRISSSQRLLRINARDGGDIDKKGCGCVGRVLMLPMLAASRQEVMVLQERGYCRSLGVSRMGAG